MVELRNVSAVIRREEATIDDARDERSRQVYTIVTAADIDPAQVDSRWYVDELGFGAKHLRSICLLYTSPSPRDGLLSRMPSSA